LNLTAYLQEVSKQIEMLVKKKGTSMGDGGRPVRVAVVAGVITESLVKYKKNK